MRLDDVETPCLLLDPEKVSRNVSRLRSRLDKLGVGLRPHLKTAKSIDVARLALDGPNAPATVSTLAEAAYFAGHGLRDLLYAVGVSPAKLPQIVAIRRETGANLTIILDNKEQAEAVAAIARDTGEALPVLLEIDADGHRSGVQMDELHQLPALARIIAAGGAIPAGVMSHSGASYGLTTDDAIAEAAEEERVAAVRAAAVLRDNGFAAPIVSVGATPTAHAARDLTGVTEVRAGVFMFFDLVQAGVGVCSTDDVAVSVLATVIGRQERKGWIIVDAGWMAMSRDRGTASQAIDHGYGIVCDLAGRPYPGLIMIQANQEHGVIALRPGASGELPDLPVGARVRVLPNHACATSAQHAAYQVLGAGDAIDAVWPRMRGW